MAALGGCTTDQQGGSSIALPEAAPRILGIERAADREHNRLVATFGGQYRSPALERDLDDIVRRVAAASEQSDQTYKVTILNSPVVNAFALPTGHVYVTRGLLALANDNSEVAAVLAHEIAHVTAKHALARAELEQRSELVSRVASEVLNDPGAGRIARSEGRVTLASFSRTQELEADRMGVATIGRAGFDAYGASRFLVSLGRNAGTPSGQRRRGMDFLSSHPSTPERVAAAIAAARQIGPPGSGDSERNRYLSALEGLVYGDDPAEGMIRGRRFAHPTLAVGFTAPPGFTLENTAEAVLGVNHANGQALRFDNVQVAETESLESFLASGWIDGLLNDSVQSTTVDGMPAATAVARGKEWSFLLGAARSGSRVFRLLFATRALTPEAQAAFRTAFHSLHRLSPEEVAAIRPMRIEVLTASEGDTTETMAARMAPIDNAYERFLVLNSLSRGQALKPGRRYKVVAE
ncbi:metalloprotease [Chelatococcus reniformis]|uniref:Metalloprotease n=1 Tax=Chelatococcus reniformis TaxID=1494448 RepID=A0A916TY16_9HYPH|nr:metalloprotease [Chelatococcus reniformis]